MTDSGWFQRRVERRHGSRPLLLGGALLCAGTLLLAACGDDDNAAADFNTSTDTSSSTDVTTGTSGLDTPEPTDGTAGFSSAAALADVDAYFEVYNAGDVDAVMALLTPDVTIDWFGTVPRTEWEMLTAMYAGRGTTLTSPDCDVTEEVSEESATVSCDFATLDGASQAVDGPPIPTESIMVVNPNGIDRLAFTYTQPDFTHVSDPLTQWIVENHPEDVEAASPGNWTTVEAARQTGELQAQLAQEWAAHLEEKGCTYLDGC